MSEAESRGFSSTGFSIRQTSSFNSFNPSEVIAEELERKDRFQKKIKDTPVVDFQVKDRDRRAEILEKLRLHSDLDIDEWADWSDPEDDFPDIDWDKLLEEEPDYQSLYRNLRSKYHPSGHLMKLTVENPPEMPFKPGDYFSISLEETPDLDPENYSIPEVCDPFKRTNWRAYTAGSSPNSEQLDFYIKRIPDEVAEPNSVTPVIEAKLDHLDTVKLKGPSSDELSMMDSTGKDIAYVFTGTGFAPFGSMIEMYEEKGLQHFEGDIWFFAATKFKDELPEKEYLQELDDKLPNLHTVPIYSRENSLTDSTAETGHAQKVFKEYVDFLEPERTDVYGCGNGLMIEGLKKAVEEEGFKPSRYQSEAFY